MVSSHFLDCFKSDSVFKLAGNTDMHNSLDEFWTDPTTDLGASYH